MKIRYFFAFAACTVAMCALVSNDKRPAPALENRSGTVTLAEVDVPGVPPEPVVINMPEVKIYGVRPQAVRKPASTVVARPVRVTNGWLHPTVGS